MQSSPYDNQFPELWQRLAHLKAVNRIAHAYLITGDNEDLLAQAARRWGRMIACQAPVDGTPCGACKPCKSFATGAYREWTELRPQSRSRKILVDEMRAFEHQLNLTPATGFRKIGVVMEADRLNDQAQNAFLKTLEEPPGNLVLLLVTIHPNRLLATIRSRCQMLSFRSNRRNFDLLESIDIVPILKKIKRNAGASIALEAATGLKTIFGSLMARAVEHEPEASEDVTAMTDQDPALKKRLLEQREARIQAEYIRLRTQVCGIVETWFQQRCIRLRKNDRAELSNPEIAPDNNDLQGVSRLQAREDVSEALKLARFLGGNLDENLTIEAFCLTVCKKLL